MALQAGGISLDMGKAGSHAVRGNESMAGQTSDTNRIGKHQPIAKRIADGHVLATPGHGLDLWMRKCVVPGQQLLLEGFQFIGLDAQG